MKLLKRNLIQFWGKVWGWIVSTTIDCKILLCILGVVRLYEIWYFIDGPHAWLRVRGGWTWCTCIIIIAIRPWYAHCATTRSKECELTAKMLASIGYSQTWSWNRGKLCKSSLIAVTKVLYVVLYGATPLFACTWSCPISSDWGSDYFRTSNILW